MRSGTDSTLPNMSSLFLMATVPQDVCPAARSCAGAACFRVQNIAGVLRQFHRNGAPRVTRGCTSHTPVHGTLETAGVRAASFWVRRSRRVEGRMGKHERSLAALAIAICLLLGRAAPLRAEDSPAKKAPEAAATEHGAAKTAVATFAGGCFWCMEAAFDGIDGVIETSSVYTGAPTENPTYEEVSSGVT